MEWPMPGRIRDLLIVLLPAEWRGAGIGVGADTPGPPGGHPPPKPPGPDPESLGGFDALELRMLAQLLLAKLGGPVTLGEMEPRSLEEITEYEGRLTTALAELRELRAELEAE